MAKSQRIDQELFDKLRKSGLRKSVAKQLSTAGKAANDRAPDVLRRTVSDLNTVLADLEGRVTGRSARSAGAKKAAATRKRAATRRSTAAKKAASTRARKSGSRTTARSKRSTGSRTLAYREHQQCVPRRSQHAPVGKLAGVQKLLTDCESGVFDNDILIARVRKIHALHHQR